MTPDICIVWQKPKLIELEYVLLCQTDWQDLDFELKISIWKVIECSRQNGKFHISIYVCDKTYAMRKGSYRSDFQRVTRCHK